MSMPSFPCTKKRSTTISDDALAAFSSDVASLHATPIAVLEEAPTPLLFMREYVALSKPVLIRNAFPIISLDDIVEKNESVKLNVDITPDGHGDTIREVDGERMFVMPFLKEMTLEEFRDGLRKQQMKLKDSNTKSSKDIKRDQNGLLSFSSTDEYTIKQDNCDEILYYSRQNDCLRSELRPLTKLFPPTIPFAEDAFNVKPDAVNLWIGNEASVSSMHKDHYENIMCVTAGEKVFTVCPPSDALFLKEANFPSGTFRMQDNGMWKVDREMLEGEGENDTLTTRWVESDVERLISPVSEADRLSYLEEHPNLKYAHPIKIHVKAGDILYLPSLWYHRVTQSCETVAVNYWYDMRFDSPNWCAFNLFQHVNDET
jgi:jumonji domain-containing protein 7